MKKKLFTYAVLLHKRKETEGKPTEIETVVIVEPKTILGRDEKDVAFKVTRLIPDEHAEFPEDVEIIIRPF